jgi:hypothetical protein
MAVIGVAFVNVVVVVVLSGVSDSESGDDGDWRWKRRWLGLSVRPYHQGLALEQQHQ